MQVEAQCRLEYTIKRCLYNGVFNWKVIQETDERRHDIPTSLSRLCLCQLAGVSRIFEEVQDTDSLIV